MFLGLRRDSDERSAAGRELRMNLLQRSELRVAVRAPASAIENDNQRPAAQQVFRTPHHSVAVRKPKTRRSVTGFECPLRQAGGLELFHGPVDRRQALGRDHRAQLSSQTIELLL